MGRKKSDVETVQLSFRCPVDVAEGLKDLARLNRCDVTDLLVEMCSWLVTANKARIVKFRQQAGQPIKMPTFDAVKKKTITQAVGTPTVEGGGESEN